MVLLTPVVSLESNEFQGNSTDWDSTGRYVAVGGEVLDQNQPQVAIYEFDANNPTAGNNPIATAIHGAAVKSVAWHPDGEFLAIGGVKGTDNIFIRIYKFDPTLAFENRLTEITALDNLPATVNSIDWHPTGKLLAVGTNKGGLSTAKFEIRIYRFDGSDLRILTSSPYYETVYSVKWNWTGEFLAVGGDSTILGNMPVNFIIFWFTNSRLYTNDGRKIAGADHKVSSIDWHPLADLVSVTGGTFFTQMTEVYEFQNHLLKFVALANPPYGGEKVSSVNWNPDSRENFLSIVGVNNKISIYELIFP